MLIPSDDVLSLRDLGIEDRKEIGTELAFMGELSYGGVKFSPSFVITPDAFVNFKAESDLHIKIKHLLGTMNSDRKDSVMQITSFIKTHIRKSPFPNIFVKKIFDEYERLERQKDRLNLRLSAYYLHNGEVVQKKVIDDISGEATLISSIRDLWTEIFDQKLLSVKELTHENHHAYGVAILVQTMNLPTVNGYIRTIGKNHEKHHYIIEAASHVNITYDKTKKKVENGLHLSQKWKDLVTTKDIKQLIEIADIADKKLYHPYILNWEKDKNIYVSSIKPVTIKTEYYSRLENLSGVPMHPGTRVGRVRHVGNNYTESISTEEVIVVKTLTKNLLDSIHKAAAIIAEDDLHEELRFYVREKGIPTVSSAKDAFKALKSGEIVSVDATNGLIRHGSVLVS